MIIKINKSNRSIPSGKVLPKPKAWLPHNISFFGSDGRVWQAITWNHKNNWEIITSLKLLLLLSERSLTNFCAINSITGIFRGYHFIKEICKKKKEKSVCVEFSANFNIQQYFWQSVHLTCVSRNLTSNYNFLSACDWLHIPHDLLWIRSERPMTIRLYSQKNLHQAKGLNQQSFDC